MKSIIQAMLEEIYIKADKLAKENSQSTAFPMGEGRYYYITLTQLETILKEFES